MTSKATVGDRTPVPTAGGWAAQQPVAMFFALAYAISWPAWLLVTLGYGDGGTTMMVAWFGPVLAAGGGLSDGSFAPKIVVG
jgi:hypothetical protein